MYGKWKYWCVLCFSFRGDVCSVKITSVKITIIKITCGQKLSTIKYGRKGAPAVKMEVEEL